MTTHGSNLYFKVTAITPVHVGMDKEKEWVNGLDYIIKSSDVILINRDALFKKLRALNELNFYTSLLIDADIKKMTNYLESKKLLENEFILKRYKTNTSRVDTIKPQLHNGLGAHYLPGSSIKGTLRSIIGAKILKQQGKKPEEFDSLFGKIDNNLMKLVQVSDVVMNKTSLVNTKIFSADDHPNEGIGRWKDQRQGGHKDRFNESGFVSTYEAVAGNAIGKLMIKLIDTTVLHSNYQEKINVPNSLQIGNMKQDFVKLVNEHAQAYINKEIKYYETFGNDDLNEQAIDFYSELSTQMSQTSCLLRIGANIGYYAITGDIKYKDHLQWIDGFDAKEKHKNQVKAKTRKFAFKKEKGSWQFTPMGWLKLELINEADFRAMEIKQQAVTVAVNTNENAAQAPVNAPEASAGPKEFTGKLKEGAEIDAKVISSVNGSIKVELLIKDMPGVTSTFSYRAGIPVGSFITVTVTNYSAKSNKVNNVALKKIH